MSTSLRCQRSVVGPIHSFYGIFQTTCCRLHNMPTGKLQSTFEYEVGFPIHALLQCVYGRNHILVSLFPWHSACSLSFHVVYPSTTVLVIWHCSRDLCKYIQTTIVYVCEHVYHLYCITINLEGGHRYKPPVVSRGYH